MTNPSYLNPAFYFLNGASAMGAIACALFFLRFWRKSGDRLFLIFSFTFLLFGVERSIILLILDIPAENRAPLYVIRLIAFLLILGGIWDKNRVRQ